MTDGVRLTHIQGILPISPLQKGSPPRPQLPPSLSSAQVSGGADLFIGYGGVIARPAVEAEADWFVTDHAELEAAMKRYKVRGGSGERDRMMEHSPSPRLCERQGASGAALLREAEAARPRLSSPSLCDVMPQSLPTLAATHCPAALTAPFSPNPNGFRPNTLLPAFRWP